MYLCKNMKAWLLYFCNYEQQRLLFSPLMCSFLGNTDALSSKFLSGSLNYAHGQGNFKKIQTNKQTKIWANNFLKRASDFSVNYLQTSFFPEVH